MHEFSFALTVKICGNRRGNKKDNIELFLLDIRTTQAVPTTTTTTTTRATTHAPIYTNPPVTTQAPVVTSKFFKVSE